MQNYTLNDKDIKQIRKYAYMRGLLAGSLIALLVAIIGLLVVRAEHRLLMDEVKATNYYFNQIPQE